MKKMWARLSCLLLALLLLATALPVFAAEETDDGAQEDTTKDYVILLDCSLSTSLNDTKNLCLQACWNFLDKLPLYDTRVSIITFGYEVKDDPGYTDYESFKVESEQDMALVHELVPLSELTSSAVRDEYKKLVQEALEKYRYESEKTFTPYTHALAAAVDMLEKNTDPEAARNACIILITDGVLDDREYYNPDNPYGVGAEAERLLTEASKQAGTHDWPIYSIQLNYDNSDERESELAAERLAAISANGGKNNIGSVACQDDNGVFTALMRIFHDFMNPVDAFQEPEPTTLPGSVYFDVEPLTSEISVDIFGEGISAVSLYQVDGNNNRVREYRTGISQNLEQKDLMVTAAEGYYSIKMICPDEGRWEVYIEGTGGVTVLVSCSRLQEMRLAMTAKPVVQEDPLTKNNTIRVDANFTYHGVVEDNNNIYTTMPAMLKVYDITGRTIYTMTQEDTQHYLADATGYHFELPLNLFPAERAIKVQVVVEDGMFRDGIKHSNIASFGFEDIATTLVEPVSPRSLEAHVGGQFKLDMRDIYNNPDGDPLKYILVCRNDAGVMFEHSVENDQMIIEAGMKPGVYEISIDVEGEDVTYDKLTLTVINDFPYLSADKLPDMELWSDNYGFQDISTVVNTLNLNDYFSDPERMELTYTLETSEGGIVTLTENGGILTAETIEGVEGEVVVTVTAADGVTSDSVAVETFEISVVSGKMVFWRENWIYFAISGAILAIIIIAIIVVLKNKLVKGEWEITVDDCGEAEQIPSIDIAGFVSVGKKSKFKLVDLMNELALFLPGGWGLKLTNYFSVPGADKLTLVGVTRKKGCDITGIPKDNRNVRVNINGMDATKGKAKFYSGTLTFLIEKDDGTGDQLTITMTLQ